MKYIGIKISGLNYWCWFKKVNVERTGARFIGKGGWGNGREAIDVSVLESEIVGEIESDALG